MVRVMVTGGNGFVGMWCVEQLLGAGHDVVVTVRTAAKADIVRSAVSVPADPARPAFGVVDLLDDDGWALAMGGCDTVLHVASPMSSLQIIARLLDGSTPALPRLGFEVVDVRDVAAAHLLAMTAPAAAGQRYIVSGELRWLGDVAAILREHLGADAAKVVSEPLDDDVLRAFAESNAELRSLLPLLGRSLRHDATKAREQLGWRSRPADDTIVESGRSVVALSATGA